MGRGHRVACVLCQRSEETKITGPLSTKEEVTAHQDCLLYSSGICCQNSPLDDDLFGFSVEDVLKEVKRGKLLKCCRCNKSGATAGCEVGRCKKSYHYPCAVEERAHLVEDKEGRYALYCVKHHEMQKNNGSVNGRSPSSTKRNTSESPSEAGPSKRNTNGDSSGAGPSGYSTDSPSRMTHVSSKRQRPSSHDSEEESPSKRKSKRRTSGLSSNSDDDPPNSEMAPIEFDFDESANSLSQSLLDRDEPFESHTSGNPPEDESQGGNEDDENDVTTVYSDAESESLLLPVEICLESQSLSVTSYDFSTQTESFIIKSEDKGSSPEQSPVHTPAPQTTEPSVPQQRSAAPFPSADRFESRSVTCSPPCTSSTVSPSPPRPFPPSPRALPLPDPGPSIDSASFWKSCNTAGCTEAIFSGFITEIYEICGRIQSDQASKEDYDHALAVMAASGKLAALVTTQQKELQRKQMELEKAAAAMTEVASALKR